MEVHFFQDSRNYQIEDILQFKAEKEVVNPHYHGFWEIGYFENGPCTHFVDFEKLEIVTPAMFLLRKGIVHSILRGGNSFGKVIMFNEDMIVEKKSLPMAFYFQSNITLQEQDFLFCKSLFIEFENQSRQQNPDQTYLAKIIEMLLLKYADLAEVKNNINNKMEEFLLLVENHFLNKETVAFYCNELNISNTQLTLLCKKSLQKTPVEIIKERMQAEVRRRLVYTQDSIKEIAMELGFFDISNFIKSFKQFNKMTPEQFRRTMRRMD